MKQVVKTHLPSEEAPIEWATVADGVLYTAQIPIREDGSIEDGPIEAQAELTFANLKRTLEAAGGTLDNLVRVGLLLREDADLRAGFGAWMARAGNLANPPTVTAAFVSRLATPDYLIEIEATAVLP